MNRLISLLAIALMTLVAFTSCTDKKTAAKEKLESLYQDASANSDHYTSADWEQFLTSYIETDSILSTCELTDAELQEVGRIKGRCAAYVLKASARQAGKTFRKAAQEAVGILDGFLEELDDDRTLSR